MGAVPECGDPATAVALSSEEEPPPKVDFILNLLIETKIFAHTTQESALFPQPNTRSRHLSSG